MNLEKRWKCSNRQWYSRNPHRNIEDDFGDDNFDGEYDEEENRYLYVINDDEDDNQWIFIWICRPFL